MYVQAYAIVVTISLFAKSKGAFARISKVNAIAFVTAYVNLQKFDATINFPILDCIIVDEPKAVKPCSNATLLKPSVIIPLAVTTIGIQAGIHPNDIK